MTNVLNLALASVVATFSSGCCNPERLADSDSLGNQIHGAVFDGSGKPVASAQVRLFRSEYSLEHLGLSYPDTDPTAPKSSEAPLEAIPNHPFLELVMRFKPSHILWTNRSGGFHAHNLDSAQFDVVVDHPSFCRGVQRGVSPSAKTSSRPVTITLQSGCSVSGSIAGGDGWNYRITLEAGCRDTDGVRAESDDLGRFRFPRRVKPGTYTVTASSLQYVLTSVTTPRWTVKIGPKQQSLVLSLNVVNH